MSHEFVRSQSVGETYFSHWGYVPVSLPHQAFVATIVELKARAGTIFRVSHSQLQ